MHKFNGKNREYAAVYGFIDEKYNLKSPVHSLAVICFFSGNIMKTYSKSKYVMFLICTLFPTIFQNENTLNLQIDEILFSRK